MPSHIALRDRREYEIVVTPSSSPMGLPLSCFMTTVCFLSPGPVLAWDEAIDSVMYKSPDLPKARKVEVFSHEVKSLWLIALQRPEADFQCQAAVTIVLAHQRGMKGSEATVGPLLESLERAHQHPSVRLATARALIELNARSAADGLFRQAKCGESNLRQIVEPALACWDYSPIREVWLRRLAQPDFSNDDLLLAVVGLGAVRESRARDDFHTLVFSASAPAPVRVEAARALGIIVTSGLEEDAAGLAVNASPGSIADRLASASLLRHHQGTQAVHLLQTLARDPEP